MHGQAAELRADHGLDNKTTINITAGELSALAEAKEKAIVAQDKVRRVGHV